MPKRLSDIAHAFERTNDELENAQDILTTEVDRLQARVNGAAEARRQASKDLAAYFKDHEDVVVVAGDTAYYLERGIVVGREVVWAHHVWVEDPPPAPSYRVPPLQPSTVAYIGTDAAEKLSAMAAAWVMDQGEDQTELRAGEADITGIVTPYYGGEVPINHPFVRGDIEPRAGEADLSAEGEAALDAVRATWEEPNGAPVTIDDD